MVVRFSLLFSLSRYFCRAYEGLFSGSRYQGRYWKSGVCEEVTLEIRTLINRYMAEKYPDHVLLGEEDVTWGHDLEVFAALLASFNRQSMLSRIRSGFGSLILSMELPTTCTAFRSALFRFASLRTFHLSACVTNRRFLWWASFSIPTATKCSPQSADTAPS